MKFARLLVPPQNESVDEKVLNKGEYPEADVTTAEDYKAQCDIADDKVKSKEKVVAEGIKIESSRNEEAKPAIAPQAEYDGLSEGKNQDIKPTDGQTSEGSAELHSPLRKDVFARIDALDAALSPASSELSEIPPNVEDVILASVTTLQALEDKIITVDGRLRKKVDGNAFKNIRVKRDNQDIGSLFEIREEWYVYKKS